MVLETHTNASMDGGEEIVLIDDDPSSQLKLSLSSSSALEQAQAAFDQFMTNDPDNADPTEKTEEGKPASQPTTTPSSAQLAADEEPMQLEPVEEKRSDNNVVEEKKDDDDDDDVAAKPESTTVSSNANKRDTDVIPDVPLSPSKDMERDFDENPTELYLRIQKKQWDSTIQRAKDEPNEGRIWVSRKEKDGRLRWRLLPIHAAIIFKAPESVVEALLGAYPNGAECKDDQGMLPLHLAFRNGSTEGIVNLLLVSFPQSINVKDRKGRIPLVLAQASTSPNRAAFLKALERGPSYYAVAAAATERAAVTSEQRAIFDTKIMQERQKHNHELAKLQTEHEVENIELKMQMEAMQKELEKTQETSLVLVDHVNSLEAQLASRSDTERFLATKIANLDSNLKNTTKAKAEAEGSLRSENRNLTNERDALKAKLDAVEVKYTTTQEKLNKSLDLYSNREQEWDDAEAKLIAKIKTIEMDWASAQANCSILEAQLKKKMNTEHALASQVSALAGKLAESAGEARDQSKNSYKRVQAMESERKLLRNSVHDLTKRLSMVATVLDQMTHQQQTIITDAKRQEERMVQAQAAHSEIVTDVMKQEKLFQQAKQERAQILSLLEMQEDQQKRSEDDRVSIMNAISIQGDHMEGTKQERDAMVNKVQSLGTEIQGMLTTVLRGIPKELESGDAMVDTMVKVCNSGSMDEAENKDSDDDEEDDVATAPVSPTLVASTAEAVEETPTVSEPAEEAIPEPKEDGAATTEAKSSTADGVEVDVDVEAAPLAEKEETSTPVTVEEDETPSEEESSPVEEETTSAVDEAVIKQDPVGSKDASDDSEDEEEVDSVEAARSMCV